MNNVKAKLIEVIEVTYCTGQGTENDPCREVVEYHLPDGTLIGVSDPVTTKNNKLQQKGR